VHVQVAGDPRAVRERVAVTPRRAAAANETAVERVELARDGGEALSLGALPRLVAELRAQLEAVRTQGYAVTREDVQRGTGSVAAPVFGPAGDAFAALSISGPTARLSSDRIASLAPLLIEESNKLAQRLGHRDHARGAA